MFSLVFPSCRWRAGDLDRPTGRLPSQLALARVRRGARVGLLTDAFSLPEFVHAVLTGMATGATAGEVHFEPTSRMADVKVPSDVEMNWLSVEQSKLQGQIAE